MPVHIAIRGVESGFNPKSVNELIFLLILWCSTELRNIILSGVCEKLESVYSTFGKDSESFPFRALTIITSLGHIWSLALK